MPLQAIRGDHRFTIDRRRVVSTCSVRESLENVDAWIHHEYPKDENGESIRHQIDKTITSEEQFVADVKSGKICKLAAQAFQTQTKFNPP